MPVESPRAYLIVEESTLVCEKADCEVGVPADETTGDSLEVEMELAEQHVAETGHEVSWSMKGLFTPPGAAVQINVESVGVVCLDCASTNGAVIASPADSEDEIAAAAKSHVEETGHKVVWQQRHTFTRSDG